MKFASLTILLVVTLFTLSCGGSNTAVSSTVETGSKYKLDDFLRQLEADNKAMLGVVIYNNGNPEYENYTGFSSVEDGIKNSSLTKFRIGSVTKMFTATLIFQLIEEGKLTLDTKLAEFFPQVQNSDKITISELLGFRSGIHDFTVDPEFQQYMFSKKSREEMLQLMASLKPDFQPDEKSAYSNTNYVLLGYIVEEVTHSTYQQELETRITKKLNLFNTYYGDKINTSNNEAASYWFQWGKWDLQPESDMSIPGGAGALISSPHDMAVFITALFNNQLISENSLKQMQDIKDGYGKGLMQLPFYSKLAYANTGLIDAFQASLSYFPVEKVAVAVTANGINYNFNDIMIGILSFYFGSSYPLPDFKVQPIQLDTEELKKYEGVFASEQIPLKLTLKVDNGQLFAQPTGQKAVPLTPFSKTRFKFEKAGVTLLFDQDEQGNIQYNSFTYLQGGRAFFFKLEK